ncbi:MAG TPA: SapC family protein [Alphaproteobacteria bacterium]|nr:SapC family protein [Alphaproteobacteria bacterium]HOO52225.1 SapC family protein [Alphaproteobacteria bacterium]
MTASLPLFYKKPEPLDAAKHKTLALKPGFGLSFTKQVNAVPITMIEMPQICHHYPIAFSPDQNATPVAILGLRDNENLFLDEDGEWEPMTYIPSYIRRYPFIFSENPKNDQLVLCVDIDSAIVEEDGEQRFFTDDGTATALSKNALEFCKSYHAAAHQTTELGKALVEADLLVERTAEIMAPNGKKINFSGFRIIDEQKLMALDDKKFLELRQKGFLPFIYAHLFSGAQWQKLSALLAKHMK